MHTTDCRPIKTVLQQLIQQSPFKQQFEAAAITHAWKTVLPTVVYKHTERVFVKQTTLFVRLQAAPLRHTLQQNKQQLIQQLKEAVPTCTVTDIVFY